MSIMQKTFKNIEVVKTKLKKEYIEHIILFIDKKKDSIPGPEEYMKYSSMIHIYCDLGDNESELLFLYHNEVVKDYLEKYYNLIILQPKDKLIDLFIKQTENINIFLYYMSRLFYYLDRFYLLAENKSKLNKNQMNLYIEKYFKPLKDNIYKELNKLIKQDRNGNKESRNKIKSVMRILNDIDINEPKIRKHGNE